jgi:hypothetical protein
LKREEDEKELVRRRGQPSRVAGARGALALLARGAAPLALGRPALLKGSQEPVKLGPIQRGEGTQKPLVAQHPNKVNAHAGQHSLNKPNTLLPINSYVKQTTSESLSAGSLAQRSICEFS